MSESPRIAVLLATHNGRAFIVEQIESILGQQDVCVTLIISDDGSTDGTIEYIGELASGHRNIVLLPTALPSGSAAANFSRLLRTVDLGAHEYFALADQDDIWLPQKLSRACMLMRRKLVDGYSASVEALFSDGRRAVVVKASPQHRHDHYFESPGPGCSFVLSRQLMQQLVPVLNAIHSKSDRLFDYHDWFIYAFARRAGFRWYIDPTPTMLYRQHANNVLGANIGITQRWRRFKRIWSGWYFDEVRWQYETLEALDALMPMGKTTLKPELLEIRSTRARLRFCFQVVPGARRRLRDRLWLFVGVSSGVVR